MNLFQKSRVVFTIFISVVLLSLGACSSTATTSSTTDDTTDTGTDDTTSTNTVTLESNDDVIANTPSPDPSSMDYAVATANGSISALVKGSPAYQSGPSFTVAVGGCFIDSLSAMGIQAVRRLERMFLCKVKGLYALAETNASDSDSTNDIDISLEDGGTVYAQLNPTEGGFNSSTQLLKIVHETGNGFGTIRAYQCSQSEGSEDYSQLGFIQIGVDTDNNNLYTVNSVFRQSAEEFSGCVQAQYTRNVGLDLDDANFDGITTLQFEDTAGNGTLILGADGATQMNTLQGKHVSDTTNMVLANWDTDSGCVVGSSGSNTSDELPFALSTDSTGAKTYSSSSGSDCENLPAEPDVGTCPEFSAITNGSWDCDTTGQTVVELSDASALEDAGGERCQTLSDAFADEDRTPDECF